MARLLVTIDVPGDPKDVFDYLSDFSSTAEWDPGVAEAERLDTGKVGLASRFRVVVSFFGTSSEFTYRLTAFERPHRFRLEGSNGMVVSEDDIAITPVAGGVRVTYDANLRLPIYLRPLDPLLQAAFQWASGGTIESLRETLRTRARNKPLTPRSSRR
jgi:carbon monoxide dehydrogenase subunit G